MIKEKDLKEAQKDNVQYFFPGYICYNCYMFLIYLCIFGTLFPLIFVKFSECWWIITPLYY